MATSVLPSRVPKRGRKRYSNRAFSEITNTKRKIRSGPQQRGTNLESVASPLPSRGPKRGWKCYVTIAFSGIPNAKHGERNQKWLPHLCLLKGPKEWKNATSPLQSQQKGTTSDLATSPLRLGGPKGNSMSPLPSRGSPTPSAGSKIRSSPQQRGTISEVAVSPLPS